MRLTAVVAMLVLASTALAATAAFSRSAVTDAHRQVTATRIAVEILETVDELGCAQAGDREAAARCATALPDATGTVSALGDRTVRGHRDGLDFRATFRSSFIGECGGPARRTSSRGILLRWVAAADAAGSRTTVEEVVPAPAGDVALVPAAPGQRVTAVTASGTTLSQRANEQGCAALVGLPVTAVRILGGPTISPAARSR